MKEASKYRAARRWVNVDGTLKFNKDFVPSTQDIIKVHPAKGSPSKYPKKS